MTADTPPPLADEELEGMRITLSAQLREGGYNFATAAALSRALAEVDRLRAELAETRSDYQSAIDAGADVVRDLKQARTESTAQAERLGAMFRALASTEREMVGFRAERDALAAKIEAVVDVITPKNPDWKPLSERHPEYFKPVTPEEAARKKGWKQGVDLLKQQLRAALGETGGTDR